MFIGRRWLYIALGLCALGAAAAGGVAASLVFLNADLADRVQGRIAGLFHEPEPRPDEVAVEWSTLETANLTVEVARAALGDVDGSATGGALEAVGDTLIYVAANGRIAFLDTASGELAYQDERAPMDYDAVRRDHFMDQVAFNQNWYRVTDALAVDRPDGSGLTLFVAHHLFHEDPDRICHRINAIDLERSADGLRLEGDWRLVYEIRDCFELDAFDWAFWGHMSGGKMVPYGQDALLFAVGGYGVGNFGADWDRVQPSADNDFAKILKIDLATGGSSVYAAGFRNPSGLAWDAQGRLWEVEHGAQSGDEVNIVREGGDYGWPNVSYGFDYGSPRKPFPLNPEQGRHDGYDKPVFAFMPAVAVSGLLSIDGGPGFEAWDGDMIMLSLKDESLYRLRPDGDRIAYAERIEMGQRLRDVARLETGALAILTGGEANVVLIRDPSVRRQSEDAVLTVSGYDDVAPLEAEGQAFVTEFGWGRMLFSGRCAVCHLLDDVKAGPPLGGVFNRPVAAIEDYAYSDALQSLDGAWTRSRLDRFIADPQSVAPGAAMPAAGDLDEYERRAVVDYLASLN